MRLKIATLVVTTMALLGLTIVLNPAPASAGTCSLGGLVCGSIKHYSPDDGLDTAIKIRCDYGDASTNHLLAEGENSTKYCKDTDQVHVADGEEIWCKYPSGPDYDPYASFVWLPAYDSNGDKMDATGWYKINDIWNDGVGCTKHAD